MSASCMIVRKPTAARFPPLPALPSGNTHSFGMGSWSACTNRSRWQKTTRPLRGKPLEGIYCRSSCRQAFASHRGTRDPEGVFSTGRSSFRVGSFSMTMDLWSFRPYRTSFARYTLHAERLSISLVCRQPLLCVRCLVYSSVHVCRRIRAGIETTFGQRK